METNLEQLREALDEIGPIRAAEYKADIFDLLSQFAKLGGNAIGEGDIAFGALLGYHSRDKEVEKLQAELLSAQKELEAQYEYQAGESL